MASFTYVASDINGRTIRGKETADDYQQLIEKLKEKNLFCTSYTELVEKEEKARYKFKTKDLAFLCRQLSSMLTSGISIVRALNILYTQQEDKKMKAVLLEIYEDVQRGRSFSESVASKKGVFPMFFVSMVAAGEASGNLDMIMQRVSDHYAKENKINNKIKSSMTYPIVLLVMMLIIMLALFTFILPMFMDMFSSPDEIPALTKAMMDFSDFLKEKWYICIAIVIALVFAVRILLKTPSTRLKYDELLCKMPKVGKLMKTIYTSRFARTMSNLFSSGMQMVECIEKSVSTLGNSYIEKVFREQVIEDVKQGESLSNAVTKTNIFEGIFTSIIYVGEESGTLDDILAKTADYYDEEADTAISKLVGLMEPMLIIVLGIGVGLVVASVLPALYGSFGAVAN